MAIRKITVAECDNPSCSTRREHTAESGPALGIFIDKGQWHYEAGGMPLPKTYACSFECLAAALHETTQQELDR